MSEINVKEVRRNLSTILDNVEQGEEIIITRRGKKVARMTKINDIPSPLPSLKRFRDQIKIAGKPLSQTVTIQRKKERN
jgi:prevent-host-death family protein